MAALGFIKRGRAGCVPIATAIPTVAGVRQDGSVLTGSHGTYLYSPTSYTYRWLRDGVAIGSATALTYTLVTADVGHLVSFEETPSNAAGAGLAAVSVETEIVAAAADLLPATQTISFGALTRKGHGGHDLAYAGTGTLSITSNPSSLFAIDGDNKLVLAGTYNAAPPSLTGPYTVVVTDLTLSSTVTVNIVANTFHVAPTPAGVSGGDVLANFQPYHVYIVRPSSSGFTAATAIACGDTVIFRDGVYNPTAQNFIVKRTVAADSTPAPRSGSGISVPTQPYKVYDISHVYYAAPSTYAGWITFKSENPLGADMRRITFSTDNHTGGAMYLRFSDMTLSGGSGYRAIAINSNNGSKAVSWVQWDNCVATSTIGASSTTNASHDLFAFDNTVRDTSITSDALSFYAYDVIIEGNIFKNIYVDVIKHGAYSINRRSRIAWNFAYNKKYNTGSGDHTDFCQGVYGGAFQPWLTAGTYSGADFVGNIFVRGDGTATQKDGQGPFCNDKPSTVFTTDRVLGNVLVNAYSSNGIDIIGTTNGIFAHNTLIPDYTMTDSFAGKGPPTITLETSQSNMVVRDNVVGGAISDLGTGNTVSANNLLNQNDESELRAIMDDPDLGATLVTITEVERQLAAKTGGALLPVGQNKIGAVGTGYVDFTNRTTNFPGSLDAYGLPTI